MKVIGLLNQKGGCGKTTSSCSLAYGLAKRGKKVLMVDMDAQCNLTSWQGLNPEEIEVSLYDVMTDKKSVRDAIAEIIPGKLDILPSTPDVAALDLELSSRVRREFVLTKKFKEIENDYDYVVLDTPPALALVTINAMVACDYIIIPTDTAVFSMKGMQRLAGTIETVRECNEDLKILGVLIVRNRANTKISKVLSETIMNLVKQFGTEVFESRIRDQVGVNESQLYGENLLDFFAGDRKEGKEDAGTDYEKFVDEVLERIGDK